MNTEERIKEEIVSEEEILLLRKKAKDAILLRNEHLEKCQALRRQAAKEIVENIIQLLEIRLDVEPFVISTVKIDIENDSETKVNINAGFHCLTVAKITAINTEFERAVSIMKKIEDNPHLNEQTMSYIVSILEKIPELHYNNVYFTTLTVLLKSEIDE